MKKERSGGFFWAALGVLALPLIIEATGGCSFDAPGVGPIDDNAYVCACDCDDGPRTVNLAVAASSDDAEQSGATVQLNGLDLDMGSTIVGMRFNAASIPQGATIQSAFVQFTADETASVATNLQIVGQLSPNAPTFTTAANDLSNRPPTLSSVAWNVGPWVLGNAGPNQRTPDLSALLQELVDQPGWSANSPIVLRIAGTGQRAARSFDGNRAQAPVLNVVFGASVSATLPICASPYVVAFNVDGKIPQDVAQADCSARVANTLNGIAEACTYPSQCTCNLVVPAMGDASFESAVCDAPCTENLVDTPSCADFDPEGFSECLANMGANCKSHVLATNAPGDDPVCVASGSPFAYQLFGRRSTCEVEGESHVEVGDREPTHDPATAGTVDIIGGPCPGGGCSVGAFFNLAMEPITFSVRFASDPTFSDLSAAGHSRSETALVGIDATFAEDTVEGTGNGRRGSSGLAVSALNQAPLNLGIDWAGRACDLTGNLASTVDGENPDGTCEGDGTTLCTMDSPDCDDVGGPCVFEAEDIEEMTVQVALAGSLVNQPPTSVAGADQTLECTSTAGASFTLDGAASSDPDQDITLVSWRTGSRTGSEVGQGLTVGHSLGVGVTESYTLRVIDSFAQTDEDETEVAVVDTTPPQLSFSVSQSTLWPPNHKLVEITASITASDTCDANPAIRLVSITSNEPDDGVGDGNTSGDIQEAAFGTDDRSFLLRAERSGPGTGRVYTITYEAADASGNTTVSQATVTVPHD
jgi:hypothetical protein